MRLTFFLLFFSILNSFYAQEARMTSEQDTIALGESWNVMLYIEGIEAQDIEYIDWRSFSSFQCPINDTISVDMDIEMISSGGLSGDDYFWPKEEIQLEQIRQNTFTNTFEIKAWEHFDCPLDGLVIMLKDSTILRSGPVPFAILSSPISYGFNPLTMGVPIQEVVDSSALERAPIVDIFRTDPAFWKSWMWYVLFGLAIVFLLYYLSTRKKEQSTDEIEQPEEIAEEPKIPAHVTALEKLHQLKTGKIWQDENDKEFAVQLTTIIRQYIEDRYDIPAPEQTSKQIIRAIIDFLTEQEMENLKRTLNISDLIKFAKAKASDTMYIQFIDDAIDLVNSTKFQKQEQE